MTAPRSPVQWVLCFDVRLRVKPARPPRSPRHGHLSEGRPQARHLRGGRGQRPQEPPQSPRGDLGCGRHVGVRAGRRHLAHTQPRGRTQSPVSRRNAGEFVRKYFQRDPQRQRPSCDGQDRSDHKSRRAEALASAKYCSSRSDKSRFRRWCSARPSTWPSVTSARPARGRTNGWSLEFAGICQSRKSSARSQTRDPCHR